jgi:hypothetical protein
MGLDSPQPGEPPPGGQPVPPARWAAPAPHPASRPPGWERQFTPLPPAGSLAPAPPPPRPLAPPPLPPGSAHWDFYQRLSRLRERSRQDAARATTLTNIGASLIVGGSILGSLFFSAQMLGMNYATGMSTMAGPGGHAGMGPEPEAILAVMWCFQLVMFGGLAAFAVSVLVKASALFNNSYQDAWCRFDRDGLAVLFAQEEFAQMIRDRLATRTFIKLVGRSTYRTLEDHLDWCACHFPALCQLAVGQRVLKLMPLRREENLFNSRKLFMQQTWVYILGGCLALFLSNLGFIFTVIYMAYGGRYINSRGVLVALCDFMLQPGQEHETYDSGLKVL